MGAAGEVRVLFPGTRGWEMAPLASSDLTTSVLQSQREAVSEMGQTQQSSLDIWAKEPLLELFSFRSLPQPSQSTTTGHGYVLGHSCE